MKTRVKKLTLCRETLRQLDSKDLSQALGGEKDTYPVNTCPCPSHGCTGTSVCQD
jgi:hypothetical protein